LIKINAFFAFSLTKKLNPFGLSSLKRFDIQKQSENPKNGLGVSFFKHPIDIEPAA